RNKADLEDQSLDYLFNNLKIYEAEVISSSSTSHNTQNIAFVSSSNNTDSTNALVSDVPSVSAANTKVSVSTPSTCSTCCLLRIFNDSSQCIDEDMLKDFDGEDLDALWRITKEKFSTAMPTRVKEKA
nr:hypothetical protein [Tanacetum cinerariifolium]